jgi:hypothetical protein
MIRRLHACLLSLSLIATPCMAELVVAVRGDSEISSLTKNEVVDIFLGRFRQLPSGRIAEPLDQAPQSPEKQAFYGTLINKTVAEINAYWARLLFSGRVAPPRSMDTSDRMLEELLRNPRAIGYIDRSKLDRRLRVVLELSLP